MIQLTNRENTNRLLRVIERNLALVASDIRVPAEYNSLLYQTTKDVRQLCEMLDSKHQAEEPGPSEAPAPRAPR